MMSTMIGDGGGSADQGPGEMKMVKRAMTEDKDHKQFTSHRSSHEEDGKEEENVGEGDHRHSRKKHRSYHSSREEDEEESDCKHSRKKHRSHHSSLHSIDRHEHGKRHSSSKERGSRHRHKHDSSSDDERWHCGESDECRKRSHSDREELEEGRSVPKSQINREEVWVMMLVEKHLSIFQIHIKMGGPPLRPLKLLRFLISQSQDPSNVDGNLVSSSTSSVS
ncbi:hypothetical protein F0562_008776 [Nyssa sinensis]|uniref:Uncharacterized protein n=1 Tax=Nyssa sinensis TaxID=561372 RepID=A0A5J5A7B7_9ASTE|nr:hypothetical protein F0562_008776 [Nyssa sinensis]